VNVLTSNTIWCDGLFDPMQSKFVGEGQSSKLEVTEEEMLLKWSIQPREGFQ